MTICDEHGHIYCRRCAESEREELLAELIAGNTRAVVSNAANPERTQL